MRKTLPMLLLAAGCYSPELAPEGYFCHLDDSPACPDGQVCRPYTGAPPNEGRCTRGASMPGDNLMQAGQIPKTGTPFTGSRLDPMLDTTAECPDEGLEPNDSPMSPINPPSPKPDTATAKVLKMAICPRGVRPQTGQHDVDYFKVDTTPFGTSNLTLMAEVFYQIDYGDLDVGIFDETGRMLASDGTSVTNACAAASVAPGVYYVVVAGANGEDVNRYDLRIRTFTTPRTCTPDAT